jgi:hypothetical protein
LMGFDMSEVERGVFGFYLKGPIRNVVTVEEMNRALTDRPTNEMVLITNRNKWRELEPVLKGRMKMVFDYRPNKRTRSYLVFVRSDTRG